MQKDWKSISKRLELVWNNIAIKLIRLIRNILCSQSFSFCVHHTPWNCSSSFNSAQNCHVPVWERRDLCVGPVTPSCKSCILRKLHKETTEIRFRVMELRCRCIMSLWQLPVKAKSYYYLDFASFPHQNNNIIISNLEYANFLSMWKIGIGYERNNQI